MLGLEKRYGGKALCRDCTEMTLPKKKVRDKIGELLEKGFASYETSYLRKDGTTVDVECYNSMIRNNDEFIGGISIVRNITDAQGRYDG